MKCPKCHEDLTINEDSYVCYSCGAKFKKKTNRVPKPKPEPEVGYSTSNIKKCPNCGTEVLGKFCPNCGQAVNDATAVQGGYGSKATSSNDYSDVIIPRQSLDIYDNSVSDYKYTGMEQEVESLEVPILQIVLEIVAGLLFAVILIVITTLGIIPTIKSPDEPKSLKVILSVVDLIFIWFVGRGALTPFVRWIKHFMIKSFGIVTTGTIIAYSNAGKSYAIGGRTLNCIIEINDGTNRRITYDTYKINKSLGEEGSIVYIKYKGNTYIVKPYPNTI